VIRLVGHWRKNAIRLAANRRVQHQGSFTDLAGDEPLKGVKYQKHEGNERGITEIDAEILQHHQPNGSVVFRSPVCPVDLSKKGQAKKIEHRRDYLPKIVYSMLETSEGMTRIVLLDCTMLPQVSETDQNYPSRIRGVDANQN
jgi:hypothetical protein